MRILLIDVNCKYSSTGKIVYDLYTNLNKEGHTASICYGRGQLVEEPLIYKFSSNIETYVHAFLTRITGFTGVYSPIATHKLIKIIKTFNPDIVHIHELHAYFVNIAPVINYLKKNNIKTIWTFHCEFMYTGKCGHAYECEKWKFECNNCTQVHEYPASLFFDFTNKMFIKKKKLFNDFANLTIVAPSEWLANRIKQSFLKDKDIKVIHNGIDTVNIFHPRNFEHLKEKHNITDEKIVLAVAPNLMSKQKGGNWILKLAKKFKYEKVKFILIGIDNVNQKFDDNIIALGRTSNQIELAEYYTLADVFVICSKRENFPTVCLEAQCCGTPVCGFNTGGSNETSIDAGSGFVEYGDIDNLYLNIIKIFEYETQFTKIKRAEDAAKFFNKKRMFNEYWQLYISENNL